MHNASSTVKSKRITNSCLLHDMSFDDRPDAARRLEEARKARGFKTASDAVTFFGWNLPSYLQHENGTRGLSRAAGKYAKGYRVSEGWLLTGEGRGPGGVTANGPSQELAVDPLRVEGRVQAGAFLDITLNQGAEDDAEPVYAPRDPRFPYARHYALEVVGDSMNKRYPDGTYAICVSWADTGLDLKDGMILHIERHQPPLVETTLKCFRVDQNGQQLVPLSTNPAHKAIELSGDEATEILVKGLVTGSWRPEDF